MINKFRESVDEVLADIPDGATIMIGGFGLAGQPIDLINGLLRRNLTGLTIVNNNAGNADEGLALLVKSGAVRKVICSFPRQVEPQGNLAERIRAAGAGIGAFFTPSGYGTTLADGKETRTIEGRDYVLEYPIRADFALIKAHKADRWGNLLYRKTSRNFGPIMAMAATTTIVQVPFLAELGDLDPENIVTPGIFVDRVVQVDSTNPKEHS